MSSGTLSRALSKYWPTVPNLPALAVAVGTYVIVAGVFTQSGVVLDPAARYFHRSIPDTALLFTYLNAGNLGGVFVCLFVFGFLTIRQTLFAAYAVFFAGLALIVAAQTLATAFVAMVLTGLGVGTGLSAGAVIIAESARDRLRATAFLVTDCAFSGGGFVFPALTGAVIGAHLAWQVGYLIVGMLPVLLLIATAFVRLPTIARRTVRIEHSAGVAVRSGYGGAVLFGFALATYLMGQNTFTIWAPTYLHAVFGVADSKAATIVSGFYGPSSLGLLCAAFLVARLPARAVLIGSVIAGALCSLALTQITDVGLFFGLTLVFGFSSTCMYKLMLSIGSEQIAASPPSLVTALLLASGIGGTAAPAASAFVVKIFDTKMSLIFGAGCYGATLVLVAAALLRERFVAKTTNVPAALPYPKTVVPD